MIKQRKKRQYRKLTKDSPSHKNKNQSLHAPENPIFKKESGSDAAEAELLRTMRSSRRRRAAVTAVTAALAALILLTWAADSGPLCRTGGGPGGGAGTENSRTNTNTRTAGKKSGNNDTNINGTVTIEITCKALSDHPKTLKDKSLKKYIPADGQILKKTTWKFKKNQTVYDALTGICRKKKIQFETSGSSPKTAYVKGIGYLYEFSSGKRSGWLFKVNKKKPDYGAGSVKLHNGDDIIWYYTIDYTRSAE